MRVLVDGRVLAHKAITGVERYATELVKAFEELGVEFDTAAPESKSRYAQQLWEHLALPMKAKNKKYGLLFCPANISPFIKTCKTVTTVHCLSFMEFPGAYSAAFRKYYGAAVPRSIHLSDKIITVSRHEAERIALRFPGAKDKLEAVYPGISADFNPGPPVARAPRIVFLGGVNPRKNLRGALKAFGMIADRVPHKLVVTGILGPEEKNFKNGMPEFFAGPLRAPLRAKVEFRGWLDRAELIELYRSSALLVFPSFYEGFGFPPLEAMACGLPAVVSNTGSLPEICGDAAVYADPHSAESIAEGMLKALENDGFRQELVTKGLARAGLFGWRKSAEGHLRVFEEVFLSSGRTGKRKK